MPDDGRPIFGSNETVVNATGVRTPPNNIPAEVAFLGALLSNNKVLDRVPFLEPHQFADPINGRIFAEARRLIGERRIADPVTLKTIFEQSNELHEVGGTPYLAKLVSAAIAIINASDYARVVRDKWLQRELIDIGEILVNEGYAEADPIKTAMEAVEMIDRVATGAIRNTTTTLDAAMDAALAAMELAGKGKHPGLSTGFKCLDARLGGLEPGMVYVLAGRPGMGKSALGHNIALNVAKEKACVLELSLEMSALQLGRRALAAASGVPLFVMKRGDISQGDAERLTKARKEIAGLPLTIDDAGGQTPREIAAKCRAASRKNGGLDLVMLDHLNLTRPDEADSKHGATYAIEKASGMMLQIAKDCGTAVLLLTQLNRAVEARDDKRPALADLRQSGSIEQDAYAVGFVYREEYYLKQPAERSDVETMDRYIARISAADEHKARVAGKAEVIWGKIRDGEPGTDTLLFDGKTTSFMEDCP